MPETELSEKTDPGFSILKALYDVDGPDFFTLRNLLGRATVRSRLNPSAKCVMADIISQRWDTFSISGNLYLGGLLTPNLELREKARKRLVGFIQTSYIPLLIEILRTPGPNVLAYEILQEATGKTLDPNVQVWRRWWRKAHGHIDIVGHLLKDTRDQLAAHQVTPFDQEKFWYVPEGIKDAHVSYAKRGAAEQSAITRWNDWANTSVKRYLEDWAAAKPVLDRITHHPDPRVNKFLERLAADPGIGDYASVVLAWRSSQASLPVIQSAYQLNPTVGRALARGSLGDRTALADLLKIIDKHHSQALSFNIMDDNARSYVQTLHTVGVIPAEQALELLTHHVFNFDAVTTKAEKKKAFLAAQRWLRDNGNALTFDRRRGYYVLPAGH